MSPQRYPMRGMANGLARSLMDFCPACRMMCSGGFVRCPLRAWQVVRRRRFICTGTVRRLHRRRDAAAYPCPCLSVRAGGASEDRVRMRVGCRMRAGLRAISDRGYKPVKFQLQSQKSGFRQEETKNISVTLLLIISRSSFIRLMFN